MKKIKPLLLLFAMFSSGIISCSKDPASSSSTKPTLSLSKSTVKIGEAVYATSTGQTAGSTIRWTTSSNGRVWTSGNTDSATYLFTNAGTYQIQATYTAGLDSAYDSSGAVIIVTDSIFNDTTIGQCDIIVNNILASDDQVVLTPIDYSDTGLIFLAFTKTAYDYSPILDCGGNIPSVGGSLECDINSTLGFPCFNAPAPAPARGIVSFTSVTNGTYTLAFKLNGILYQGSITATDDNCTIVWNHSSGVTISPLVIKKQFHL